MKKIVYLRNCIAIIDSRNKEIIETFDFNELKVANEVLKQLQQEDLNRVFQTYVVFYTNASTGITDSKKIYADSKISAMLLCKNNLLKSNMRIVNIHIR